MLYMTPKSSPVFLIKVSLLAPSHALLSSSYCPLHDAHVLARLPDQAALLAACSPSRPLACFALLLLSTLSPLSSSYQPFHPSHALLSSSYQPFHDAHVGVIEYYYMPFIKYYFLPWNQIPTRSQHMGICRAHPWCLLFVLIRQGLSTSLTAWVHRPFLGFSSFFSCFFSQQFCQRLSEKHGEPPIKTVPKDCWRHAKRGYPCSCGTITYIGYDWHYDQVTA